MQIPGPAIEKGTGGVRPGLKSAPIYVGLFLLAFLFAVVNLHLGRSEFGGYDLSAMIDGGYRVLNGQVPSSDFVCTYPPTYYLFAEFAFRIFGLHWSSILAAENALYLLLVLLGLRLCWLSNSGQQNERHYHLAWIYVAAQSMLLLAVNHLWHSTTASGFAAYAILVAYALTCRLSSAQRIEVAGHLAFTFSILLLSKPNTAWPAILVCIACLFKDRQLRLPATLAFVIAVLADICLLRPFHVGLLDVLHSYLGLSGRAIPRLFIVGIYPERNRIGAITVFLTYAFLSIAVLRMLAIAWRDRARIWRSSTDLLCFGAALVSLIGLGTNWDLKVVDVAPLLVGMAIFATTNQQRYERLMLPLEWSVGLLLLFVAVLGIDRIRMKEVGPWAGKHYGRKIEIHDPFFGDFTTRQAFGLVLQEADVITSHSSGKRIFFGPRMEFLYARDRLTSPSHLPLCWHPGTSYPMALESSVEDAWEKDKFDVLIFNKDDRTRFPEKILNDISAEYTFDGSQKAIDVYYRR